MTNHHSRRDHILAFVVLVVSVFAFLVGMWVGNDLASFIPSFMAILPGVIIFLTDCVVIFDFDDDINIQWDKFTFITPGIAFGVGVVYGLIVVPLSGMWWSPWLVYVALFAGAPLLMNLYWIYEYRIYRATH